MFFRTARSAFRGLPLHAAAGACLVKSTANVGPVPRCDAGEGLSPEVTVHTLTRENTQLKQKIQQLEARLKEEAPIYRVVITGGPCAGKTTALSRLRERLENAGWRVFTVPEAATLLFHNGARFHDFLKTGRVVHFQTQLSGLQLRLEQTMSEMASSTGQKSVLLCDRGLMDGKAYCTPEDWAMVVDGLDQTESKLRDQRYDAVIHLATAAKGAEKFYTLQQVEGGAESARTETIEEAAALDDRTSSAWIGHEHLYIIDNSTGFADKMDRAVDRVLKCVGETVPGHTLRKIRLPHMTSAEIKAAAKSSGVENVCVFHCSTTFVSAHVRVRCRSDLDHSGPTYYLQRFKESKDGTLRRIRETIISSSSYMQFRKEGIAAGFPSIEKELVCFKWQGVVYEVNVFKWPEELCILEVEAESSQSSITVPPFLKGVDQAKEVTKNKAYESRMLAARSRKESILKTV